MYYVTDNKFESIHFHTKISIVKVFVDLSKEIKYRDIKMWIGFC